MSEIIRLKKPNTRTCDILLDSSLAHEIREIQVEIERLEKRTKGAKSSSLANPDMNSLDSLREKLEKKEDEAQEHTASFTFQDIGRKRYDDLLKEHPPSDEEKKEYKDAGGEGVLNYSFMTFPQALVSATAINPTISSEEADQIFNEWSEGDLEILFNTALIACKEPTSLPKFGAGTVTTPSSEPNSTTALNEESPTPDS